MTRVPVDAQGRMRADALPAIAGPTILCLQAGNVNTGAFDPFDQIIRAGPGGRRLGARGWRLRPVGARHARRAPHLAAGIELADSWATDAHKWLNVPYDSGIAFVRDAEALRAAMAVTADYLPTDRRAAQSQSDYTPELSRRARGVDVWAALATLGRAGVADMIERCCRHARRFAAGPCGRGLQGAERRGAEPGAGVIRHAGTHAARDRGRPAGRHLLVRQHRLAGRTGHAHQRVLPGQLRDEDVERSLAAMLRIARGTR